MLDLELACLLTLLENFTLIRVIMVHRDLLGLVLGLVEILVLYQQVGVVMLVGQYLQGQMVILK